MNKIAKALKGEARFRVTGAAPQEALNRMMRSDIIFWDIQREDELHCSFSAFPKDKGRIEAAALQAYCTAELLWARGLRGLLLRMKKRPVLMIGLFLALAASFFLQSFVWVIQVKGLQQYHEKEILRALEEEGITFGAWAGSFDSQELRLKMLSRLPNLSWLAVNRKGGKLTVLLTEKEEKNKNVRNAPGNLIALREGVITEFNIYEGMRLCGVGDTVSQGQLLVSGMEDYGIYTKLVHAEGEIYARTWRSGQIARPMKEQKKVYTGRQWTQISLLIGNKRINLYGNSGILYTSCDKMIDSYELAVSGYAYPIRLERVTYREYQLLDRPVERELGEKLLLSAWEQLLCQEMIAGEILTTNAAVSSDRELYILSAESSCQEMIARWMPLRQLPEGEDYDRTNYQRRTD